MKMWRTPSSVIGRPFICTTGPGKRFRICACVIGRLLYIRCWSSDFPTNNMAMRSQLDVLLLWSLSLLAKVVMNNFTPHGYLAIIKEEIKQGLKQVDFANKSGNRTGGGGTHGTGGTSDAPFTRNCYRCGAAGVQQFNCPKCNSTPVNLDKIIVNGTTYAYSDFNTWTKIEPTDKQSKQIRHGNKCYHWCNKCGGGNGKWCYHYRGAPRALFIQKKEKEK